MAFLHEEERLYGTLKSGVSVNKAGLVLHLESDGTLDLAMAGEPPFGVAYKTTEDPLNPGTYLSGVAITVIRRGVVYLQLPSSHSAISIGDRLCTDDNGYVVKFTGTDWPATYGASVAETIEKEKSSIVGIALESKAKDTGGKIKALLTIHVVRT
ncbi:MAG: hypothetical protein ACTSYJ_11490 [Candidatus Thorarchaeota archaeon]